MVPISQYITDDLWKNGAGTYRLQADIKLNTDYTGYDYQDNNVVMGITNSAWSLRSTTSIRQEFEISDEWQTYRATHSHQHVPSLDENASDPGNDDQTLLLVQTTTSAAAALVERLALA